GLVARSHCRAGRVGRPLCDRPDSTMVDWPLPPLENISGSLKCGFVWEAEDGDTGYATCEGSSLFFEKAGNNMKKRQAAKTNVWLGALALTGVLLIGTASAASTPVPTSAVVGDWKGAVSTGSASLRVLIHVAQDTDGKLTATMDSPDQGATGIAIS